MHTPDHGSILAMSRPLLVGLFALFVAVAIGGTWALFGPLGWGAARIVIAGALFGALAYFMLFINRLLVS